MTAAKPPAPSKKPYGTQVFEILVPSRLCLLLFAATIIAGASLELAPPLVMKQVVDAHLTPRIASGLWSLAAAYFTSIVLIQASNFLATSLTTRTAQTAQTALHNLRVRLFTHLQRLPIHYFDQNPLGDMISRCTADVDAVDQLFSSGVMGLITGLVRLLTLLVAMVILSPSLTLVLVLVMPPLVWVTNTFRKHIRDAESESRLAIGVLTAHLQETLGGVEVIRAFGREQAFVARFRGLLKRALTASNHSSHYSALYSPILQVMLAMVISLLF